MGIQRRLQELEISDLELLMSSWLATCLPSIHGSLLALILFILFLTGIIGGSLFPSFEIIPEQTNQSGIYSIINIQAASYQDAAKLIFWSFFVWLLRTICTQCRRADRATCCFRER